MTAAAHRRARLAYLIGAPIWLLISLGGIRWPWINTYLAPKGSWIWLLVGALYHHGWLKGNREAAP